MFYKERYIYGIMPLCASLPPFNTFESIDRLSYFYDTLNIFPLEDFVCFNILPSAIST
jgi:hypothetical protein